MGSDIPFFNPTVKSNQWEQHVGCKSEVWNQAIKSESDVWKQRGSGGLLDGLINTIQHVQQRLRQACKSIP